MTLLDICDLVHTLQVERIERRVLAERQMSIHLLALGVEVDLPDMQEAWDEFEAALIAPPAKVTPVDQDREDLLRALGLR